MKVLSGKTHNLGEGFNITRLLPDVRQRSVGPFIFFDAFGPVDFAPGKGIDVRPHPHIGLATVTYLFEGNQMHRDTLGTVQQIEPGDVNWMTAGRGIAHSERTGDRTRAKGHRLHGIQTWVGLPTEHEDAAPGFQHFKAEDLPRDFRSEIEIRMIVGSAFGLTSPVKTFSPIFYADVMFDPGGSLHYIAEHEERAVFIVEGELQVGGDLDGVRTHGVGSLLVLDPGEETTLFAGQPARAILFGGAPLDGPRHIWWNFVSSDREKIERAKQEWKSGVFGTIAGDDQEFIPLPEEKKPDEKK